MSTCLLRLPDVIKRTGLGRTSIYVRVRDGLFPRPINLGNRLTAYPESDVESWVQAMVQGANEYEIRALVKSLHARRNGSGSTITPIKSHLPKIAKERAKREG